MKPNPILKHGDIIHSGEAYFDGEDHTYHLKYVGYQDNRSIAPKDAIDSLIKLGLDVSQHWNTRTSKLGHMASENVRYHSGEAEVALHIKNFLSGGLKNDEVKFILEAEY